MHECTLLAAKGARFALASEAFYFLNESFEHSQTAKNSPLGYGIIMLC